ncbi:MAG: hypothetical protein HY659_03405 [Rhizobiales bacterium]|nr:hypothetical protein [Hyphomicrobiales bacterium]
MTPTPEDDEHERRTTNLILLAIVAGLIIIGIWIVNVMIDTRKIQDCVAQGRRNCAPIDVPGRD